MVPCNLLIADNYPHAAAGAALTGNELLMPPPKATKATAEAAEATTAPSRRIAGTPTPLSPSQS
jgi:hypothetical protein